MSISRYCEDDYCLIADTMEELGIVNRSFLITGATGMIGSYLISALSWANRYRMLSNRIVAIVRDSIKASNIFSTIEDDNLCIQEQDITKPLNEKPLDYVIHCASNTNSQFMVTYPVETIDTIYTGTKNILEYAVQVKAKKVVFLSSMEVYGIISKRCVIREDEPLGYLNPLDVRSSYPMGKRIAENLCISYFHEYNVPVVVLRLAQTFGPVVPTTDNRLFAQLIRAAQNNTDIILHTTGEKMNNFCYLGDVITAIIRTVGKGEPGNIYNVSDRQSSCTIREMAELVAGTIMHGKIKITYDINAGQSAKYAKNTQFVMDNTKLIGLGWEPTVSLREALIRNIFPDVFTASTQKEECL